MTVRHHPNKTHFTVTFRDVAARPPNPPIGGGPGQLWGPKLV